MAYRSLADSLRHRLNLPYPPVAMARVASPPEGVASAGEPVPSACSFWRLAEQRVFYASADDHFGCPVGAMVMGFELPPAKVQGLMGLVGDMCKGSYLDEAEVAHIARFASPAAGIVYGPLADFPLEPDAVLIWTTPAQAMVLQETTGATRWGSDLAGGLFGRPTCAALPAAVAGGRTTMSLGCIGMRTFTRIPDECPLVAIPGSRLDNLEERLRTTADANARMREFYVGRMLK